MTNSKLVLENMRTILHIAKEISVWDKNFQVRRLIHILEFESRMPALDDETLGFLTKKLTLFVEKQQKALNPLHQVKGVLRSFPPRSEVVCYNKKVVNSFFSGSFPRGTKVGG